MKRPGFQATVNNTSSRTDSLRVDGASAGEGVNVMQGVT